MKRNTLSFKYPLELKLKAVLGMFCAVLPLCKKRAFRNPQRPLLVKWPSGSGKGELFQYHMNPYRATEVKKTLYLLSGVSYLNC